MQLQRVLAAHCDHEGLRLDLLGWSQDGCKLVVRDLETQSERQFLLIVSDKARLLLCAAPCPGAVGRT